MRCCFPDRPVTLSCRYVFPARVFFFVTSFVRNQTISVFSSSRSSIGPPPLSGRAAMIFGSATVATSTVPNTSSLFWICSRRDHSSEHSDARARASSKNVFFPMNGSLFDDFLITSMFPITTSCMCLHVLKRRPSPTHSSDSNACTLMRASMARLLNLLGRHVPSSFHRNSSIVVKGRCSTSSSIAERPTPLHERRLGMNFFLGRLVHS